MKRTMAKVKKVPDGAVIAGGMDVVVSPLYARPGIARLAYNYEYSPSGGVDRIRGIEPFDGHPSPSAGAYAYFQCSATITGILLGDTVTGGTTGYTGKVIYLSGAFIAVTRTTGSFVAETLKVGGVTKATISNASASVDGFLDNIIAKLTADEYQADITKVPGEGRVRGLAVVNDLLYAWRNNVGSTAMAIFKQSASGWTSVPLMKELSFNTGADSPWPEGSTVYGNTSAATGVVARCMLESSPSTWVGGSGRLILSSTTGTFQAGEELKLTNGAGVTKATCVGAQTQITLAANGVVRTHRYSFTGSAAKRLYGCDGVNREFEFDGTVMAPITTGMGSVRARAVQCHKNHLMFAYKTSIQHSSIGFPYVWSPVTGAAELSCGDDINDIVSIGGQSDAASLFVACQNSIYILYGTSSANWNLVPLSHTSGGQMFSCQDIGGIVAMDNPGVMRYPQTLSFGNFAWNNVSTSIQPLVLAGETAASVWASNVYKYRLFFTDGTAISGLPIGNKGFAWSVINYGINIQIAICEDINSIARTFYADDNGWVYEADVGRSFAGADIEYALKLHPMSQRSPMVEKTYREGQIEIDPKSAFTLYTQFEFGNNDDGASEETTTPEYGAGGVFDLTNYDASYWDVNSVKRLMIPVDGQGTSIAWTMRGKSNNELTHTIYSLTNIYTPRRMIT